MRPSSAPVSRVARLAAAAVVCLGAITAIPAPAYAATAATAATAAFAKESQWSTGYTAKVTIHNTGSTTLTSWRVEFDLPAGTTPASYWNARMTRDGSHFVF